MRSEPLATKEGPATAMAPGYSLQCPVLFSQGDTVLLGHGSGGRLTADLIRKLFVPALGGSELARLGDAAILDVAGLRLAFTTDGFVVDPLFFPGSDVGALSVYGTVNDLAVMGARPLFLSAAFILEEGLPMETLGRVVASMAEACRRSGVRLVTGDTKVVQRGGADGLFITTSGVGLVPDGVNVGPELARPGDVVVVTGPVGSHGVAVMSKRAGIEFEADVASDTAPLTDVVHAMLQAGDVHCLRDATRGGLASVLNELAEASGVSITLDEGAVPILEPVRAACEMLGLDPFYVANEGVCVGVVSGQDASRVVEAAHRSPLGQMATVVGRVEDGPGAVRLRTSLGATRPLLMLAGDQLPRIC
jgi:hydrogenase expression/formation protein HypE